MAKGELFVISVSRCTWILFTHPDFPPFFPVLFFLQVLSLQKLEAFHPWSQDLEDCFLLHSFLLEILLSNSCVQGSVPSSAGGGTFT